jgi:hypothetical protein
MTLTRFTAYAVKAASRRLHLIQFKAIHTVEDEAGADKRNEHSSVVAMRAIQRLPDATALRQPLLCSRIVPNRRQRTNRLHLRCLVLKSLDAAVSLKLCVGKVLQRATCRSALFRELGIATHRSIARDIIERSGRLPEHVSAQLST